MHAGLWERWTNPEGESLDTFTVVKIGANDSMRALYDRMPVVLQRENYGY
ncbi:MAG: SOS response-associated peptidase family protein [Thauera sp.]|nr:SOS response-associated peptidase family protein [Thauera sp.]